MKKILFVVVISMFLCSCDSGVSSMTLEEIEDSSEFPQMVLTSETNEADTTGSGMCMVYVCGAVEAPGVYELLEGSRIVDAISLAGGITEDGAPTVVNLAEFVHDGEQIYIPTFEEVSQGYTQPALTKESESGGLVNINTATKEELMTLSGIGESRAEAIIEYREANGNFSSIEDIQNVSGIGPASFERLKAHITVD